MEEGPSGMWRKFLGGNSSNGTEKNGRAKYRSIGDEIEPELKEWWKPLRLVIDQGILRPQPALQSFLKKAAEMGQNEQICTKEYLDIRKSVDEAPWFENALTVQTNATNQKNRYRDVLPFEETRVHIRSQKNDPAGDYINANFILDKRYIACCAPPPNVIYDFWSMIWYENVHVILMLTNFIERELVKADMYWDGKGRVVSVGNFTVQLKQEEISPKGYTTRIIELTNNTEQLTRHIYHVQLTTWPDHGVLRDFRVIEPMLHLVHGLNKMQTGEESNQPIVVHCSAGIGRSGTFIAIDYILNQLREISVTLVNGGDANTLEKNLDVRGIVQLIRCQRPGMVQTPQQYQMIYNYVAAVLRGES